MTPDVQPVWCVVANITTATLPDGTDASCLRVYPGSKVYIFRECRRGQAGDRLVALVKRPGIYDRLSRTTLHAKWLVDFRAVLVAKRVVVAGMAGQWDEPSARGCAARLASRFHPIPQKPEPIHDAA